MALLARKCTKSKWSRLPGGTLLGSDSFLDVRTSEHTLSFWLCEDSEAGRNSVAAAVASAGDRLDSTDVVWVPKSDVEALGVTLVRTDGRTAVTSMVQQHVDAVELDVDTMAALANLLGEAVLGERVHRLAKGKVKTWLLEARARGEVDEALLTAGVVRDLGLAS